MSRPHPVAPGECLSSIAHRYGFGDPRAIWNHPDNEELRKKRPDPNALLPGDVLAIPDKEPRTEIAPTGRRTVFRCRRPRAHLRLLLRDEDGTPLAGKKYWLVAGNLGFEGRTDGAGRLDQEIPPRAVDLDLVVWMDEEDPEGEVLAVPLKAGHLPPLEDPEGVRARLENLGYPCGGDLAAAIRSFQKARGLPETGTADDATREALRKAYEGT